MHPLLETIKIKNGKIFHLNDHQNRMDRSVKAVYGSSATAPLLHTHIQIPKEAGQSWYKCRVIYGQTIGKIEYSPYQPQQIESIELVYDDAISYEVKWVDRTGIDLLKKKSPADDIIIVKEGYITDSSYANLLFHKNGQWFTPEQPLLAGTQRARLLSSGQIKEVRIKPEDLRKYDRIKWINAMLDMNDGPEWPLEVIKNLP